LEVHGTNAFTAREGGGEEADSGRPIGEGPFAGCNVGVVKPGDVYIEHTLEFLRAE